METQRIKSMRAARRLLEKAIFAHAGGHISPAALSAATAALKAWSEIYLVELELTQLGLDAEREHPLGIDGGLQPATPMVSPVKVKTKLVFQKVPGDDGSVEEVETGRHVVTDRLA